MVSNSKLNFLLRTIEQIVEQLFGKLTERCITLDSFERMVYVQMQEVSRLLDFEVSYYSVLDIYCEVRYFVRVHSTITSEAANFTFLVRMGPSDML